MDSKDITGGNGASDAELKQWLGEVCPVVARALELPRPMERAADQFFKAVPVGTALRWVEMLGMGKADDIRLMVKNTPNAAVKLSSPEGLWAIRSWDKAKGAVPVLRALEGATDTIPGYWRREGRPRRAVIRTLAALGVSHLVPGATVLREEVAGVTDSSSNDTAHLIESYSATAVADETGKIAGVDRLISGSLPFGPWVRSLWISLKLRLKGARRGIEDDLKGHPLWRLSLTLREIAGTKGRVENR